MGVMPPAYATIASSMLPVAVGPKTRPPQSPGWAARLLVSSVVSNVPPAPYRVSNSEVKITG